MLCGSSSSIPQCQRILRIDVDNPSPSPLIGQVDANRDSHSHAQLDRGRDQCSMQADHNRFAIACSIVATTTVDRNHHFNRDAATTSRLLKRPIGSHWQWNILPSVPSHVTDGVPDSPAVPGT